MREIVNLNPYTSFGFIGANMANEPSRMTERFKVYSRMMATYFSRDEFRYFVQISKSTDILIRNSELTLHLGFPRIISENFIQLYDYFD